MSDGNSPDTTPGLETGASPAQQSASEATLPADTPRPSSIESLVAQPIPDISAEEAATASAERSRLLKELIPQLDAYGITIRPHPKISEAKGASPIVLLSEPAGGTGDKSFRFLAVTERGVRVVDKAHIRDVGATIDSIDRSGIDPDNTVYTSAFMNDYYEYRIATRSGRNSAEGMYLGRDATPEEAMQALTRSIQRARSTSITTPPAPYSDLNIKDQYRLRDIPREIARAAIVMTKGSMGIKSPPPPNPFQEARTQHSIERGAASDALKRFRERYKTDPSPAKADESFEAVLAQDEARMKTPDTFTRDQERQRIDTATRMTELLKEPMATIQPASPAPTSQAA